MKNSIRNQPWAWPKPVQFVHVSGIWSQSVKGHSLKKRGIELANKDETQKATVLRSWLFVWLWVVTDKFNTRVMTIRDLEKGCKPETLFFGACLLLNWPLTRVTGVANSELHLEQLFIWFFGNKPIPFLKCKLLLN